MATTDTRQDCVDACGFCVFWSAYSCECFVDEQYVERGCCHPACERFECSDKHKANE